jgi:serine/threonine protein kinase
MSNEMPLRGARRFGDYELLEKIGQGGMSTVYKARDARTQDIVALKIASRLVMDDRQLSRRFELEFAVAHPLDHRNLVKVLHNGKHDKVPYLVMEFIDGPSLSQHLKTHERLSEHQALAIVLPIGEALTYLHQKQIIHRDIKPANILLTSSGEAKLADLGLLKNLESLSRLTRSNFGLGTMQFAAPEQFDDARSVDTRCDVYSLAATLYLTLTGEYPFGKGAALNVLERKLHNKFEAPISKVPQLRPSVDRAIRLALSADRQCRPASINDFVALLTGETKLTSAADLPGTMPPPAAKATIGKKTAQERRGGARYVVELEAACRAVVNAAGQRWPATITDLSVTGLCLLAKRRFETGSVLEVTFTLKADDTTINLLARVRWAKSTESKSWLLGCEFVKAIADDDLNMIFANHMDKTRML